MKIFKLLKFFLFIACLHIISTQQAFSQAVIHLSFGTPTLNCPGDLPPSLCVPIQLSTPSGSVTMEDSNFNIHYNDSALDYLSYTPDATNFPLSNWAYGNEGVGGTDYGTYFYTGYGLNNVSAPAVITTVPITYGVLCFTIVNNALPAGLVFDGGAAAPNGTDVAIDDINTATLFNFTYGAGINPSLACAVDPCDGVFIGGGLVDEPTTCGLNNGSITANPFNGTGPYTVTWSNGSTGTTINNLASGTYSATITDANLCSAVESTTVASSTAVTASASATTDNTACVAPFNGAVTLTTTGTSFIWSNGATTQNLSALNGGTYTVTVSDASGCSATASATVSNNTGAPAVTFGTATANTACIAPFNGTVSVSSPSGVGVTYIWSTGATTAGISAVDGGTYTVTVTNASSCSNTASIAIPNNTAAPAVTFGTATANTACVAPFNGAVSVSSPSGAGVSYTWSTGATTAGISNVDGGTYAVTVTNASGCSNTASVVVPNNTAAPTVGTSITSNTACAAPFNGTVTLTTTGTSFAWSNGETTQNLSGLAAGTYVVTVSNATGCSTTVSAVVTTTSLTASASASPASICPGQSSDLTVTSNGTGATYLWSNGATTSTTSATPTATTSYTVTVTANGCTATASATVAVGNVTIVASTVTPAICSGSSATLIASGGGTGASYTWSNGAGSGASVSVSPTTTTTYTVTATNGGCSGTAEVTVSVNDSPTATATASVSSICSGGEVELTATGGTSYTWSNGAGNGATVTATPSTSTAYTVTVTNAQNCTATASTEIVTVLADPDNDGICGAADTCPDYPGVIGDSCSDSNPNTTGDILNGNCECAGVCPDSGLAVGATCDDGNANTVGDVINTNCQCVGTLVGIPSLLINEVDYDQPGDDVGEFIEIYNAGTAGVDLSSVSLVFYNGDATNPDNAIYASITLPSDMLEAGEYYVVCFGGNASPYCDYTVNTSIQNGPNDGIALSFVLSGNSTVLDALSYEGSAPAPYVEGSGEGLEDNASGGVGGVNDDKSISRIPDHQDTNINNVDFQFTCATPGAPNIGDADHDGVCDNVDTCPTLAGQIGDSCNDGNANTTNDVITSNCTCQGTVPVDCPALGLNIGASCDDGDATTINDTVNANCQCVGTSTAVDCPSLGLNIGASCNDGNSNTVNDVVTSDCQCVGTVDYDCDILQANVGDSCNDGNANTTNDTVNTNCQCVGTPISTVDCPALGLNIGASCNDGNANTTNDTVNANCQCVGTPVSTVDCPALGLNIGASCNDGNANTANDTVNANCQCVGTPVCNTPNDASTTAPTSALCNDANEGNTMLNLDALVAGTAGGSWSGNGVSGNMFNAAGLAVGSYNVTYTVAANGACPEASSIQTVTVQDCNVPPVALDGMELVLIGTQQVSFNIIQKTGSFDPNGDNITLVDISYNTAFGTVTQTGNNLTVVFAPGFEGNFVITYTISDGTYTSTGTYTLSVGDCVASAGTVLTSGFACAPTVSALTFEVSSLGYNTTYIQDYILTDLNGNIVEVSADGEFNTPPSGSYHVYAINYDANQAPDLTVGTINALQAQQGNSNVCFALSASATVRVLTQVVITGVAYCDPTVAGGYFIDLTITGGFPQYSNSPNSGYTLNAIPSYAPWNPATQSAQITLGPIPNGATYTLNVDGDGFLCIGGPFTISYNGVCEVTCDPTPGVMPSETQIVCGGSSIVATAMGAQLDENEVMIYVLHTNNTMTLGTVLAVSESGMFTFPSSASYNTTYYISSVVGPDMNNDGMPDMDSECTAAAAGTPVVFLSPINVVHNAVCISAPENAPLLYNVSVAVSGGYNDYMPSNYTVQVGSETTTATANTNVLLGTFSNNTSYTVIVADGIGCTTQQEAATVVCEPTPVELIAFEGEVLLNGNMLKWVTASEIENDFFTLRRSADGINFVEITQIDGKGSFVGISNYQYLDKDAPAGLSYYQLSQTDVDGTTVIVGTISLLRGETSLSITQLVPVPATSFVNLNLLSNGAELVTIDIFDVAGKRILTKTLQMQSASHEEVINVEGWATGVYMLSVNNGRDVVTTKFVKE